VHGSTKRNDVCLSAHFPFEPYRRSTICTRSDSFLVDSDTIQYNKEGLGLIHLTEKKTRPNDGKQVPTSGREKRERRLQNRVYKHGELLLSRWLHKPWE